MYPPPPLVMFLEDEKLRSDSATRSPTIKSYVSCIRYYENMSLKMKIKYWLLSNSEIEVKRIIFIEKFCHILRYLGPKHE